MTHPVARLVAGEAPTGWARPLLPESTAAAGGVSQVFVVLERDGEWLESSSDTAAGPNAREWHTVDADLRLAARSLSDIRDENGTLVELHGSMAAALLHKPFRKAALKRLGAVEALAVCPDGQRLRIRDAWRQPRSAQVEALKHDALPGSDAIWMFNHSGVHSVVKGDVKIDANGDTLPFSDAAETSPAELREQIIFTRALLAFMAGLLLAGLLGAAIRAL